MTISDEELEKLRKLEARATPGPWEFKSNYCRCGSRCKSGYIYIVDLSDGEQTQIASEMGYDDPELIVAMRNTIPALLDEVEKLRKELEIKNTIIEDLCTMCSGLKAQDERTKR